MSSKSIVVQRIDDDGLHEQLGFNSLSKCDEFLGRWVGYTSNCVYDHKLLSRKVDGESEIYVVIFLNGERQFTEEYAIDLYERKFQKIDGRIARTRVKPTEVRRGTDREEVKLALGMANMVTDNLRDLDDKDPILYRLRRAYGMTDSDIANAIRKNKENAVTVARIAEKDRIRKRLRREMKQA